jgi:KDO2-lipid IV(A) lauroyltransferase
MHWFIEKAIYLATWLSMEALRLAVKILPRNWLYSFADGTAALAFSFFCGFRRRSLRNVELAFDSRMDRIGAERTVRASLRNFFRAFIEAGAGLALSADELRAEISIVGREHLDAALSKGNGVIVLSAHLGNFFLLGACLGTEGYPTYVLVNQPRAREFATLMDDYRLQTRQMTIHARPRQQALRELGEVLRRNELAVVIADEFRHGSGVSVPFFGKPVIARRGPATLALRTGAAVVPMCLVRDNSNKLKLLIEPEIELVRSEKSKAEIRENILRMTQWLERTIRAYPGQWNWMNIHWQGDAGSTAVTREPRVERLTY